MTRCVIALPSSLPRAGVPQRSTPSRSRLHCSLTRVASDLARGVPCYHGGFSLSTPTLLESRCLLFMSYVNTRTDQTRVFPLVHSQLVPNGGSPSEMTCVIEADWTFK